MDGVAFPHNVTQTHMPSSKRREEREEKTRKHRCSRAANAPPPDRTQRPKHTRVSRCRRASSVRHRSQQTDELSRTLDVVSRGATGTANRSPLATDHRKNAQDFVHRAGSYTHATDRSNCSAPDGTASTTSLLQSPVLSPKYRYTLLDPGAPTIVSE